MEAIAAGTPTAIAIIASAVQIPGCPTPMFDPVAVAVPAVTTACLAATIDPVASRSRASDTFALILIKVSQLAKFVERELPLLPFPTRTSVFTLLQHANACRELGWGPSES
ncbi:hypothetical protein F5Y06DRAFT_299814 [Hypoxylon sp. FL0890]|nr:hypothetical protein F5Y06DRAFT_299814 [Hypoxylon sp. FL0890]